jgi:transcriptional regulator with XRE-family HTH domain
LGTVINPLKDSSLWGFELGLTQEELAERANLHPTYIGSVERGERNISLENIVSIAKALQINPKDLFSN